MLDTSGPAWLRSPLCCAARMNLRTALPVRKKAWVAFSSVLFALAWLLWMPVQSKPLVYFWELWPMLFTSVALSIEFWLWLLESTVVFLIGAVLLGWVMQFIWGLLLSIFSRRHEPTA